MNTSLKGSDQTVNETFASVATNSSTKAPVVMKVVKSADLNKEEKIMLDRTRRLFIELDVQVYDISEEDCMNLRKRPTEHFVLARFGGLAFEHLKSLRTKMYGAPCILLSSERGQRLPKISNYPIFSFAMEKAVVCCSNIEKAQRDRLYEMVHWMSGTVSKSLTAECTHLVTAEVGSAKYRSACVNGMRILLPEWIEDAWTQSGTFDFCAIEPSFCDRYALPIFKGVTATSTGFAGDERKYIMEILKAHGGSYIGELKNGVCTHLIVHEKGNTTEKYRAARSWNNVFIVSIKWLDDSLKRNYCLNPEDYPIDPPNKTSTPTHGATTNRLGRLSDPNCSAITNFGVNPNCSVMSNASAIVSSSNPNMTHINETVSDSRLHETSQQRGVRSAASVSQTLTVSIHSSRRPTIPQLSQSRERAHETSKQDTPLQDLDLTITTAGDFLSACRIFLSGFDGERLNKLRRIINAGGGRRLSDLTSEVTHVVAERKVPTDVEQLNRLNKKPFVVTSAWLVHSFKAGKRLPETDFLFDGEEPPVKRLRPSQTNNEDDILSQYRAASVAVANKDNDHDGDDTLLRAVDVAEAAWAQEEATDHPQRKADITPPPNFDENINTCNVTQPSTSLLERAVEPVQETIAATACSQPPDVFDGLLFTVCGFSEDDERTLVELVSANGGTIVGCDEPADYCIMSTIFLSDIAADVRAKEFVTNAWLQCSLEVGELLPLEANPLYKPINVPTDSHPLEKCVVTITGYQGVLRDTITHICQYLGGKVQSHFVRKPTRGLDANTHLIAIKAEGDKFLAAQKWNIPVVSLEWLVATASSGKLQSEQDFAVGRPLKMLPETACQHTRLQELRRENEPVMLRRSGSEGSVPSECDSPGKFLDPNRSFHPRFDVVALAAHLETPEAEMTSRRESLPLDQRFDRNIRIAVDNMANAPVVYQNRGPLHMLSNCASAPPSAVSLPADVNFETPKRTELVRRVGDMTLETPVRTGPLTGVVIYVSKKLSGRQNDLNKLVIQLGGSFKWAYDQSCTHFIYLGREKETAKEYRIAREDRKHIVAPAWVHACVEQNARVSEFDYPHTYKEKTPANTSPEAKPISVSSSNSKTRGTAAKVKEPTLAEVADQSSAHASLSETGNVINQVPNYDPGKDDAMVAQQCDSLDVRLDLNEKLASVLFSRKETPDTTPAEKTATTSARTTRSTRLFSEATTSADNSHIHDVEWEDPNQKQIRARLGGLLKKPDIATQSVDDCPALVAQPKKVTHSPAGVGGSTFRFLLTGIADEQRRMFADIVRKLGGQMLDDTNYDASCTHLIMAKPARNEKVLASIACGKWVLCTAYLHACEKAGRFVDEEAFEWGAPQTDHLLANLDGLLADVARACHRWRTSVAGGSEGAYQGWKVILYVDKAKEQSFKRLLEAGGAHVQCRQHVKSLVGGGYSMAFMDPKCRHATKDEFAKLKQLDIMCVKPDYIAAHLTHENPQIVDYCIDETNL